MGLTKLKSGESTHISYHHGSQTAPDPAACSTSLVKSSAWHRVAPGQDLGSDIRGDPEGHCAGPPLPSHRTLPVACRVATRHARRHDARCVATRGPRHTGTRPVGGRAGDFAFSAASGLSGLNCGTAGPWRPWLTQASRAVDCGRWKLTRWN